MLTACTYDFNPGIDLPLYGNNERCEFEVRPAPVVSGTPSRECIRTAAWARL